MSQGAKDDSEYPGCLGNLDGFADEGGLAGDQGDQKGSRGSSRRRAGQAQEVQGRGMGEGGRAAYCRISSIRT